MPQSIRLLFVLALACCAPAQAVTELRLWSLLNGGDGERMRAMIDDFNASQHEVKVIPTTLKWGEPFYTKLITASVVGAGPDLATVHLSRIGNLAGGGVLRPLAPADIGQAGLRREDFHPRQWDKAQYQGQTYAIPLDLHTLVLYYNKALAGRAGLLDPEGGLKPLNGIAALTAAFKAVKDGTGAQGMTMESSAQSSYAIWRLWLSMLAQQHIPLITGTRFSYGEAGVASLAVAADWFAKAYASRGLDYAASTSQFISGNAGFMINGVWEVPALEAARRNGSLGFEYGIVPLPRMYADASAWGDSHGFAVPVNGDRPLSAEKMAAVMRFVGHVSRHSLGWARGGHLPAYRPVAESAEARSLMPNAMYAAAADNVVYDPEGWYAGAAGPLQMNASRYLPGALSGQLTPAQALALFEAESARLLTKRPPKY